MHAFKGGGVVTMVRGERLRRDAREELDIELPSRIPIRLGRLPVHLKELEVDLEMSHVPILQPLAPLHRINPTGLKGSTTAAFRSQLVAALGASAA